MTKKRVMFAVLSVIFLALVLAPPLAAQKNPNQEEKETVERYKRANALYLESSDFWRRGKLEKARKKAEECLAIDPQFSDAHLLMARLDYQAGALEPALKHIEAAKSGFAAFGKFHSMAYQDYLNRLREDREKKKELVGVLTERLAGALGSQERTHLNMQINELNQALTEADIQLHKPIPTVEAIPAEYDFVHGNILFKLKRFDEARGAYLAAVSSDPHHANAYNNLINLHFIRGDWANAAKYLQQAEANGVMVNEKLKQAVLEKQPPQ